MTWHIVCLAGANDKYEPKIAPGDQIIRVPFGNVDDPDAFQSSIPQTLAKFEIKPGTAAFDLLCAAIGAYTGDVRIPRHSGYDGWTRDLALHIAVNDLTGWQNGAKKFSQILAFLTGDHWEVYVRETLYVDKFKIPERRRSRQKEQLTIETNVVTLFSGGLDSFIGSLDFLNKKNQIILVGHNAGGQGATSVAQKKAEEVLQKNYSGHQIPFLRFWLTPLKKKRFSETTTRGRSILFLALGVAVASNLNGGQLIVPENGFISLNVPLTPARSGSFSTRTTHPYLIKLLQELLIELKIPVRIILPYKFKTKGEMLKNCADQSTLAQAIPLTMSCAHPGVGRYERGGNPNQHCGYCIPCLVRRAALSSWGVDNTSYRWLNPLRIPILNKKSSDLRSLQIALTRYSTRPPTQADLLATGPISNDGNERKAYLEMFSRGLDELRLLLKQFEGWDNNAAD